MTSDTAVELRIEYMFLDELQPAWRNPKTHDVDRIAASMQRHGYADAVILDERTQRLAAGHGRVEGLGVLWSGGGKPPAGIRVVDGRWMVPVQRGWSSADDAHAEAFLLTHNQTTIVGGWNRAELEEMLDDLALVDESLFDEVGMTPIDIPPADDSSDPSSETEPACALAGECARCGATCPVLDAERSTW